MRLAIRVFSVVGCIILSACDPGDLPGQGEQSPTGPAAGEENNEEAGAVAAVLQAECEEQTGDFLDALGELDSRLGVGLQFDDYLNQVGDVRVAYDQVPFDDMAAACIQEVGLPAERALNLYVQAGNIWNNCIGNFDCSLDDIEPQLQRKWAVASRKLADAEQGLEDLGEP
jgi:hypothetical protein